VGAARQLISAHERRFMLEMMDHPSMIRNVAIAGHLHHGKTSLMDTLVLETHQLTWDADAPVSLCAKT
jgi:U5 small nuclear ribonucleoprotein component